MMGRVVLVCCDCAVLFGGVPWIVAGAALGTAFAMFDRGIKNNLLKELGEKMTSDQSALAVLIEEADWATLKERFAAQNFGGEVVVSQLTTDDLAEVEKLADDPAKVETVPAEIDLAANAAATDDTAKEAS